VDDVTTARLKAAGCVVLGKTNVPEFAHLPVTQNLVHGRSSNPHDPERTCGGSSGGSAVAVATGMCSVATAADGGGSTRIPAALCGLVGLKPSAGRIPSSVADTWGGLVSSGTVTRTVRDAAIQLDVLAGPHSHLAAIPLPPESFEATLGASLGRLRIGWSETLGYVPVRPEVARLCVQTVEKLADAGHEVESLRDQLPDTRPHPHGTLVAAGVVASILSTGGDLDEPSLSPTLKDMYVEVGRRLTAVEYVAAQARRWEIAAKIGSYFDRHDVVVTPTLACAAMRHDEDPWPERGLTLYGENHWRWYGFAYPFNLAGLPAISVPAGRTSEGLPVGLQIIGPQHQDGLVLRVAAEIDEIQPWDDWPIT
jgi:aspartyl-tRNA(Asn)/glutamyl-tRNA(Gln) amidotransferase subunit A